MHVRLYLLFALLIVGGLLSYSYFVPSAGPTAELIVQPTSTSGFAERLATPDTSPDAPTPTPAPPGEFQVRVWWPDEIYPSQDDSPAALILARQLTSFTSTYATYDLDLRRKRSSGLGGILPSLRTAAPVAPGTLPDLTLMRRADMVTAAAEGLIEPLGEWVPIDIMESLIPGVQAMGEIDGVLYGVPYTLNITHTIYRQGLFETPPLTFEDILSQQTGYLFPAGPGPNIPANSTLLLQYLAAGGRLIDPSGSAVLDRDALLAVLDFYAAGVERELFTPALLEYTEFGTYWNSFMNGEAPLIVLDSTTYLSHKTGLSDIDMASIPTLDGVSITLLDGWMWVLTTHDQRRQEQARPFLSWIMRVNQQSVYTEALGVLPSTQQALRLWSDQTYATFAQRLIAHGQVLPSSQGTATVLQESLAAVLAGVSAETAANEALTQLPP